MRAHRAAAPAPRPAATSNNIEPACAGDAAWQWHLDEKHAALRAAEKAAADFQAARGALPLSELRAVWSTSDIHCDFKENMAFIQGADFITGGARSALIVAGDVGTCPYVILKAMRHLKTKFGEVFWCCGNHELWTGPDDEWMPDVGGAGCGKLSSLAKLRFLIRVLGAIGVRVAPRPRR